MEKVVLIMLIVIMFPIIIMVSGVALSFHKSAHKTTSPVSQEIQIVNSTASGIYVSQQNKKGLHLIRESWEWAERESAVVSLVTDPETGAIETAFSEVEKKLPENPLLHWATKIAEELSKVAIFYKRTKNKKEAVKEFMKDEANGAFLNFSLVIVNLTFFFFLCTRQNIFIVSRQIYNQ